VLQVVRLIDVVTDQLVLWIIESDTYTTYIHHLHAHLSSC
jgi:hypothetical protein